MEKATTKHVKGFWDNIFEEKTLPILQKKHWLRHILSMRRSYPSLLSFWPKNLFLNNNHLTHGNNNLVRNPKLEPKKFSSLCNFYKQQNLTQKIENYVTSKTCTSLQSKNIKLDVRNKDRLILQTPKISWKKGRVAETNSYVSLCHLECGNIS